MYFFNKISVMDEDKAKVEGYRDLIVWQKSIALVKQIYQLTQNFPDDEKFGLISQMRRAAVSRQDTEGDPIGGWQPQEKLTIEEAIRCHTFEPAYAEFSENEKGEIKAGMLADLVVHSKDLLTIPHKEILTTEPIYTIFNGQIIYEKGTRDEGQGARERKKN